MPNCDPNDAIPRTCAESFQGIMGQLECQAAKLDAIHEQTRKTNGHVADLYRRTGRNKTKVALLAADVANAAAGQAKWGRRVWQVVIGLVLLLAGYLLKS